MSDNMEYNFKPEELIINGWDSKARGAWSMQQPNGVQVVHLPTGIVITCDEHRGQHKNRHHALLELQRRLLE